jgi:hypothetical protein
MQLKGLKANSMLAEWHYSKHKWLVNKDQKKGLKPTACQLNDSLAKH